VDRSQFQISLGPGYRRCKPLAHHKTKQKSWCLEPSWPRRPLENAHQSTPLETPVAVSAGVSRRVELEPGTVFGPHTHRPTGRTVGHLSTSSINNGLIFCLAQLSTCDTSVHVQHITTSSRKAVILVSGADSCMHAERSRGLDHAWPPHPRPTWRLSRTKG
jgi:hypothetical protein